MGVRCVAALVMILLLVPAAPSARAQGGDGLRGDYWNFNVVANGNQFPTSAPNQTRVDPTVDFDWGTGNPAPGIGNDDFAVRWSGMLQAPETGNYIFSTQSDDGVRLWINGNLVINNWTLHAPTWNDSAPIHLDAGQRYEVRMELFERGGFAVGRFYWRKPSDLSAGLPRNRVPQQYLFSQVTPTVLAVVQSCTDLKTLSVSFSRPMQGGNGGSSAERTQNYDVLGSPPNGINVIAAALESDAQTVTLTLNKSLIAGHGYTLLVKDVRASDGVLIDPNPTLFTFTAGAGDGLMASFWNFDVVSNGNLFPSGPASVVRQDAQVDFDWGSGSPDTGINADRFAARWEGFVEAPSTGNYTFWTQSDDGVRLWVNGNLVIDNWTLHGPTWNSSAPIGLVGGQRYALRMEHFERTGQAVARLHWQTPGGPSRVAIPSSQLFACPGTVTIDHIRLLHPGTGLTCAAADITVQACANADCSVLFNDAVTVDLSASPGGTFSSNPVVFSGGSATVSLRQVQPGIVALDAVSRAPPATGLSRCFTGALETCALDFRDSGFLFDVPTLLAGKPSGPIQMQAVRTDDTTQTCAPAFSGTRAVQFWSDYVVPASGATQVEVNGQPVPTAAPGAPINLDFDATASTQIDVRYADAGSVRLHARFDGSGNESGLLLLGSDDFVARPVGLLVRSAALPLGCAAADASCPLFARAGAPFPLEVGGALWVSDADTNRNDNPITANFAASGITLTANLLAPSPGVAGVLSTSNVAVVSGGSTSFDQTWSEVGVLRIDASLPDYLGTGPLNGQSAPLGRFAPDHFGLAASPSITVRSAIPGCAAPLGPTTFQYMDEPFILDFSLQARALGNGVTRNYEGAFARLDPTNPATLGLAVTDGSHDLSARLSVSASGAWSQGQVIVTAPMTFARANPADGPYALALGMRPLDGDGTALPPSVLDLDIDGGSPVLPTHQRLNTDALAMRHGRMALYNALGSELSALTVPLRLEYFNGSGWMTNVLDDCTPLTLASQIFLSNPDTAGGVEQSGNTLMAVAAGTSSASLLNQPPALGAIDVSLSAPGAGNTGWIDLRAGLLGSLPYLQFDWDGDGAYDDDPRARATFGVFAGPERQIDLR